MTYKKTDNWNNTYEAETMLGLMKEFRVFEIEKQSDGTFYAEEACDNCFSVTISKDELLTLAEELKALAET